MPMLVASVVRSLSSSLQLCLLLHTSIILIGCILRYMEAHHGFIKYISIRLAIVHNAQLPNMSFWKSGPLDKMSFGFEAEFLVSIPQGRYPRICSPEGEPRPSLYSSVVNTLKATGLRADKKSPSFKEWQATYDSTIEEPEPLSPNIPEKGGVEVISPVFLRRDIESARTETRQAFRALEKAYGPLSSHLSCGLHVHVGSVDGRAMSGAFQTVKNLALLTVAFEHLFNGIVPDQRLAAFHSMSYPASKIRSQFMHGLTLPDHLILIARSADLKALVKAVNPVNRYTQVNLQNLVPRWRNDPKPRTIEFRHFAGTVDPELILHYADLCTSLVAYAHAVRSAELDALLRKAYDPRFGFFDLLGVIGCGHLRTPFLALWKPVTKAKNLEPPWHPRWWEPEVVDRSAQALNKMRAPESWRVILEVDDDGKPQPIIELKDD